MHKNNIYIYAFSVFCFSCAQRNTIQIQQVGRWGF